MAAKSRLNIGDTVYEVLLYKVRRACVTDVRRIRLDDPAKSRVFVYSIRCDDESPSPRYYESDIGVVIFTDITGAYKKLESNLLIKSELGGRLPCACCKSAEGWEY